MIQEKILLNAFLLILLLGFACKKDEIAGSNSKPYVTLVSSESIVWLPGTSATLEAIIFSYDIKSILWTKIAGPASYTIENPKALKTQVTNLVKGNYEFEITVTNKKGLYTRDTIKILVRETPPPAIVNAYKDTTIQIPFNRAGLGADIQITDRVQFSAEWKKIAGPLAFRIYQQKNSTSALVTDLTDGVYQFEITITDQFSRAVKDTMTITAHPDPIAYTGEIIFSNLKWSDFWGYSASISLDSNIISSSSLKVFIKSGTSWNWEIVAPTSIGHSGFYNSFFEISGRELNIYTYEQIDLNTPIKILY